MVAILGRTGMLGSMVTKTWQGEYVSTDRADFDAESDDVPNADWIINCIGVIKPYCHDVERAIRVNSLFPHKLPQKTIQIATDCVYSGKRGGYIESDPHDAADVYGKTKSLGEATHIKNLRCSIIGPELQNHLSLLDWFLSQDSAKGYTNHYWNGITTYHFSLICQAAIILDIDLPNIQHIVPADTVNKAQLLKLIAKAYKKNIPVEEVEAIESIDRTLATNNPRLNLELWQAAGYPEPPTIEQMVYELAEL